MNKSTSHKAIPIVLSSDNNYHLQLIVTIMSIIKNRVESTDYSFFLLVTDDFDLGYRTIINNMLKDHGLQEASFIEMGSSYDDAFIGHPHLTKPCFYRLSLPDLLNEDKCIYLDVDIIVKRDLSELFDLLQEDQLVAGVKAASYYWPPDSFKERAKKLMIPRFDSYVNSGVLVLNLSLMRKMGTASRFEKLLDHDWDDQDIINSACYGNIEILPPKYNSMTKYSNDDHDSYRSVRYPYLKLVYTEEEWKEACEDPQIIHYADWRKPWNDLSVPFAALWWQYLKLVDPYYPCIKDTFLKLIQKEREDSHKEDPLLSAALSELQSIKNSFSFRIGRVITFPFRMIKKFINRT